MSASPSDAVDDRTQVAIVVAMTRSRVIGQKGRLPWDLPAERQLFRRLTIGNTVIMGRKTFESLPGPLAGRHNIILSRLPLTISEASVCNSFKEGIALGRRLGRPVFVIGGVDLYREALPMIDELYISWIDGDFPGDRVFPEIDLDSWLPMSTSSYPGFQHTVYHRRPVTP
jgi:dihydrofolate reductase